MALLNYVDKLLNAGAWNNYNDYRLIFTGDGHITTHGVDYTALFNGSPTLRGLVSSPASDAPLSLLTSKNEWVKIEANLGTTTKPVDINNIPNIDYVHKYMNNQLSVVDVMRFKGVVYLNTDKSEYYLNGDNTIKFPASCEIGDTYRSGFAGSFAGHSLEIGDLLICVQDATTGASGTGSYWTVVQTNISTYSTITINDGEIDFYGTGSATIYAPTSSGTANQILFGNTTGSPTWVNVGMSIDVNKNLLFCGKPTNIKFGTNINVETTTTNNITTYTISTIAEENTWRVVKVNSTSIGENALNLSQGDNVTLTNVNGTVTISAIDTTYTAGTGLTLTDTEFNLLPATSGALGGIQLGYDNTNKPQTYPVQVDTSNKAYVEVPWQNEDTWREILVNGEPIDEKDEQGNITQRRSLNIMPSKEIHVVIDNESTSGVYEIGFGLQWYNINTGGYEYVN